MVSRQKLLILHGAMGSAAQMKALGDKLEKTYEVHYYDFPGHGGKSFAEKELTMPLLVEHLQDHVTAFHLTGCHVFGYSMGGYAAIWLEAHKPGTFASIMTLGTKFAWNEETANRESKMIEPSFLEEKAPNFVRTITERHYPQDWKRLSKELSHMMHHLGRHPLTPDHFGMVDCKVRISVGDRDQMVSVAESEHVFGTFPKASFLVMPDTPHLIEKVNLGYLADEITRFHS